MSAISRLGNLCSLLTLLLTEKSFIYNRLRLNLLHAAASEFQQVLPVAKS
jgi:hypothetical protein